MKRMLICGDRFWGRVEVLPKEMSGRYTSNVACFEVMKRYIEFARMVGFNSIVEGEALGADSMSGEIGTLMGFEVIRELADWGKYHKGAGLVRNSKMLTYEPQLVIAFHGDISQSRGTLNMITQARKAGVPVILVDAEEAVQVFLPTKATWMIMESVKGFLVTLVQDAMNAREGEVPFTRDDAEEFMKERGLDAVHK